MADAPGAFDRAEHRGRVIRLQDAMQAAGQDALLLTTAPDIFYVTGFLTRFWESPARPWFVVIPATGDPIAVIPSIGAALMGRTWIADIRTWDAPDPTDDGVSLLADTLCACVPDTGTIGLPMGAETHLRMPLADWARVVQRLGTRRIACATTTVQRVREIKSSAEVERIRTACVLAGRAFARVPDFATLGRPLDAVFRDFQIALLDEGADWVAYVAGAAGPGGYGDVISLANDRPLGAGDVLMLDTGAVHQGYYSDFDRNFAIGHASDATRRTHAALHAATGTALASLRPGQRACDLHGVLQGAMIAEGASPSGVRFGHGLGLTLTEWPSISAADRTELREGMVLTLEPGAEIAPGRILVHEEVVVLRANGAELLTDRAPPDLPGDRMSTPTPYRLTGPIGTAGTLGLIVLQQDETIEQDFRRLFSDPATALYVSRIPSGADLTTETIALMEYALPAAAALLPPAAAFDTIGYACTSGTTLIGADRVASLVRGAATTRAVTDPLSAALAALRALDVRSIGILSPYVDAVARPIAAAFTAGGFSVPATASFGESVESRVARIDPASILEAGARLAAAPVDAVFLSCTNLRTLDIIDDLEARIGRPVVSSNLALAWHMARQAGVALAPDAPGRLAAV